MIIAPTAVSFRDLRVAGLMVNGSQAHATLSYHYRAASDKGSCKYYTETLLNKPSNASDWSGTTRH